MNYAKHVFGQGRLALACSLMQRLSSGDIERFLKDHQPDVTQDEGYQWCDVSGLIQATVGSHYWMVDGEDLLEGLELSLVMLEEGFRPHYHRHSDSVIVVFDAGAKDFEATLDFSGKGSGVYHDLSDREVLYHPRELVHDVRRKADALKHRTCQMLVASSPPIAEDDTRYP